MQTLSSLEPKPVQENKGHVRKEYEGITVRYFQTKFVIKNKHVNYWHNVNKFINGSNRFFKKNFHLGRS